MKYRSTRSNETVTALEALVKGLADDGGRHNAPESRVETLPVGVCEDLLKKSGEL